MKFLDIESGSVVTLYDLKKEYLQFRKEQPNEYDYPFADYVKNCMTSHNGTLELIK